MSAARLPVTVIGGYLGAGKTTLVNHLLRHAAGRRLAVLVNDFGALPIDAALIEGADGDVLSLAGGCICCSYGSDLVGALIDLPGRAPHVEHVLIETSGVALPGAVSSTLSLLAGYRLDAVVVVADAETVRQRAVDPYMADTIARQLAAADLVLLNKADLVTSDALAGAETFVAGAAPTARILRTRHAATPIDIVLGARRPTQPSGTALRTPGQADAASLYESLHLDMPARLDLGRLGAALVEPTLGIVRAKGLLHDCDGTLRALHIVGTRWSVDSAPAGSTAHGLVLIGLRGAFDGGRVRATLTAMAA
ncbi:MAG: GTP-binding protein [Reyranellaceae bacterium]